MKKVLLTVLAMTLAIATFAQEEKTEGWSHKGNFGLNFGQSTFTNWAAGGQNSLNWQGMFNYEIHYLKGNFKWDNTLNSALGYTYYSFKQMPIKTDDKIEFTSLAGLKATEKLNYSAELAFRSQCAPGYEYGATDTILISKFLAPAYVSLGLGMEWVPNEHFSIYFSPVTGRLTIISDTTLAYRYGFNTLDANDQDTHYWGDKVRYEFGARAVAKFQYPLAKNIDFNSKLELFSNYLNHPERIDVDWQNMLVMKVNSWLICNLTTHLIYDYDIPFEGIENGSKVQFKEVLAIGFMINLK